MILIHLIIEKVINELKVKLATVNIGIEIGGETVSMIKFAGDIVVIAMSEGNTQYAVNEMHMDV